MRTEQQMLDLILGTGREDERIRAVILNGSRANPRVRRDPFQDFDIVYVVTEVTSFRRDPDWIRRFGEIMVMQTPEDMDDPPPTSDGSFVYLMQFADGNRIDLTLFPAARIGELERESLSVLLLDKDAIIEPFPPPSDRDHLPQPPTAKQFSDCCNEFWWICPYIAKGLWRQQIAYAKHTSERYAREQLMRMLTWHVGVRTRFEAGPGKMAKDLEQHLEPQLWALLLSTYSDATYRGTWAGLHAMCDLFRVTATGIAVHFGFEYPHGDDRRVSAHLRHVEALPRDATEIY